MSQYILLRGAKQLLTLRGPSGVRRGPALHDLAIIEDGSILIRDGKIAAVGSSRRVDNLKESRAALEISASGYVVSPGFIDANISLSLDQRQIDNKAAQRPRKIFDFYDESLALMRLCLQHGTLTAEIKASADRTDVHSDVALLRQIAKIGKNPIDTLATWRLHQISDDAQWVQQFRDTLALMTRRRLLRFVEFLGGDEHEIGDHLFDDVRNAGVSMKLKWTGGSTELLHQMLWKARPMTISVSSQLNEMESSVLASSPSILVMSPGTEIEIQNNRSLRKLADSGAAMALSSGYDNRHSPGFSMEAALSLAIVQGGLTPEEAFTAATINAAHAIGCAEVTGTLEAGKRADILVLTVPDYREIPREFGIGHVGMVIRNGALVFNRTSWKMGA